MPVDEDGCCIYCGCDADGPGARRAVVALERAAHIRSAADASRAGESAALERVAELEELLQIERDANEAAVGSEAAALERVAELEELLAASGEAGRMLDGFHARDVARMVELEELLRRVLIWVPMPSRLAQDIRAALAEKGEE